jgi:hypothetical protein
MYEYGLAYLAAHQGPQAAAEFQKIPYHPTVQFAVGIVPLAHPLKLADTDAQPVLSASSASRLLNL